MNRIRLWVKILGILLVSAVPFILAGCEGSGTVTVTPAPAITASTSTTASAASTATASTNSAATSGPVTGLGAPLIIQASGTANVVSLDGEETKAGSTPQTPAVASKPQDKEDNKEKVTQGTVQVGTSLNVRSSPWGKIIDKLKNGNKVEIIGKEGDWFKIKHDGKVAYVHSNYISAPGHKASQNEPSPPQSTSKPPADKPDNDKPAAGSGRFGAPVVSKMPGRTSSEYGPRSLYGRSFHHGIDIPIPTGTPLHALGDGVVTAVSYEAAGGRYVKIKYDNGYESVYAHLQGADVRAGQRVAMGQVVARSDNTGQSTGPHLHLGIRKNGVLVNPRTVPGIKLPPR